MNTEIKPTLKYTEYKNIISEQIANYEKTVKEFKNIYSDYENVKHLFILRPLTYIEYCQSFNFKPEKTIINHIQEEEGVKLEEIDENDELYE